MSGVCICVYLCVYLCVHLCEYCTHLEALPSHTTSSCFVLSCSRCHAFSPVHSLPHSAEAVCAGSAAVPPVFYGDADVVEGGAKASPAALSFIRQEWIVEQMAAR